VKFNLPFRGGYRAPTHSQGSVAEKRRNGALKAKEIAEKLVEEGIVVELWTQKDALLAVRAICEERARDYGDTTYVSSTAIWTILRTLLRNQQKNG